MNEFETTCLKIGLQKAWLKLARAKERLRQLEIEQRIQERRGN